MNKKYVEFLKSKAAIALGDLDAIFKETVEQFSTLGKISTVSEGWIADYVYHELDFETCKLKVQEQISIEK